MRSLSAKEQELLYYYRKVCLTNLPLKPIEELGEKLFLSMAFQGKLGGEFFWIANHLLRHSDLSAEGVERIARRDDMVLSHQPVYSILKHPNASWKAKTIAMKTMDERQLLEFESKGLLPKDTAWLFAQTASIWGERNKELYGQTVQQIVSFSKEQRDLLRTLLLDLRENYAIGPWTPEHQVRIQSIVKIAALL